VFGIVLILLCAIMQAYVVWRATGVPAITRRVPKWGVIVAGAALWLLLVLGRTLGHDATGTWAVWLERVGMTWLGCLLLLSTCLLAVDLVAWLPVIPKPTGGALRGWALVAGLVLSVVAVVQALRPPAIVDYEVRLPGLPVALDGTVLVALSDLHLGSELGERWLSARVEQVRALHPDIVVLLGDIVEGHGGESARFLPGLKALSAPLGVWAVTGNHETGHGRLEGPTILEDAGFHVLHGCWKEVRPGLVLAGVDDMSHLGREAGAGDPVAQALEGHPPGGVVFLSHAPVEAERAAASGAGLMLSGHTHGGQIWPFSLLVRLAYPRIAGRYEVDGMTLIVSRGTGTWGPRMRLWPRGEILRVILRAS
jgi:uncharacterized protein